MEAVLNIDIDSFSDRVGKEKLMKYAEKVLEVIEREKLVSLDFMDCTKDIKT